MMHLNIECWRLLFLFPANTHDDISQDGRFFPFHCFFLFLHNTRKRSRGAPPTPHHFINHQHLPTYQPHLIKLFRRGIRGGSNEALGARLFSYFFQQVAQKCFESILLPNQSISMRWHRLVGDENTCENMNIPSEGGEDG